MHGTGLLRRGALAGVAALLLAACGSGASDTQSTGSGTGTGAGKTYVVGVSNTLVGNGWREEMICSVKAQSLASGVVSKVVSTNRNGGPTEQIADLRSLISQGVDAIIVNPSDPEKLNPVIAEAKQKGVVVVAVDSTVTAPDAYLATNDQVAYGRLGAEWLFEQLGGTGNVVEMRGIPGVQADTDRHTGFTQALARYPGIKVVKEVNTGWDFSKAGQQALDILNSSTPVDGIWTSGMDYTVVNAFKTLGKPYVPVVGADDNEFINQLANGGAKGAAVTNPAAIGAVGVSIALAALQGKNPPRQTTLTPQVWSADDKATLTANYFPTREPTFSSSIKVDPYTTYTQDQLFACKGPGE